MLVLCLLTAFSVTNRRWAIALRSEEHTSELQSRLHLVCRLLLEKKKSPHRMIDLAHRGDAIACHVAPRRVAHPQGPPRCVVQPARAGSAVAVDIVVEAVAHDAGY